MALFTPELHGDHAGFKKLAEPDAHVMAGLYDVGDSVVDRHIENNIRERFVEPAEDRLEISRGGNARHMHPKRSRRRVAQTDDILNRRLHFDHRRFEACVKAFARVGRRLEWRGSGAAERGLDAATGKALVEIDPRYFRPTEVDSLIGDASKARQKLGWHHKVSFAQLVEEMVDADLKAVRNEHARRDRRE